MAFILMMAVEGLGRLSQKVSSGLMPLLGSDDGEDGSTSVS